MNVIKQIIKAPYKSNSIVRVQSYKHTKRGKECSSEFWHNEHHTHTAADLHLQYHCASEQE